MESILVGICLVFFSDIKLVQGQCDISHCQSSNPLFTSCNDYIQRLDCMRRKYDGCNGQASLSEYMLSAGALSQPSDCELDVQTMARSMSARSSMVASMMKRTPAGAMPFAMPPNPFFPSANGTNGMIPPMFPGMMGDDMDDFGDMDMEPFDDMDDMWEDMMESGMMHLPGMLLPGMKGGVRSTQPRSGPASGPSKAKFVYNGNNATSNKFQATWLIWTMLAAFFLSL